MRDSAESGGPMCRAAVLLGIAVLAQPARAQFALHFGVAGAEVRVADPGLPDELSQLTVEVRVRSGAAIRTPIRLVSRWSEDPEAADKGTFHLSLTATNRLSFAIRDRSGKSALVGGTASWRGGGWHHLAATYDGTRLLVYLDGKQVGEQAVDGLGPLGGSRLPLIVGPTSDKPGREPPVFDGFLGDVRVHTRALAAAAIQASAKGEPGSGDSGLLLHLPLRRGGPAAAVEDRVAGRVGRLSPRLVRSGWCLTTPFVEGGREGVDLTCIDLHAAPDPIPIRADDRKILVGDDKRGRPGVLWQDENSREIHLSWVDPLTGSQEDHRLDGKVGDGSGTLAAGTTDPQGNVYYLVYQDVPFERAESVTALATLFKATAGGEKVASVAIDNRREAFNVWTFRPGHGNMRFSKGVLGLVLPRRMYVSRDGLRHQAAIAVTFSAKTLAVMRNLGTTSSHSKGNWLTVNDKGSFVAVDLGDNYPRGVHLHEFSGSNKMSAVVFTFKTAHGTQPRNGSPPYDEISKGDRRFYRWSNDNDTYTELGAVVEDKRSYAVIFATDRSTEGKVLDNSRAFRGCDDPRDLAMVRVVKRFGRGSRGSVVSDSLMVGLGKDNAVETGGFFNFTGGWTEQRVTGVVWLTRYRSGEAARAPQAFRTGDGGTLILWEKSSRDGSALQALRIDRRGRVGTVMELGAGLRFNREDRVLRLGDRVYLIATEVDGSRSRLYFLRDGS